MNGLTIDGARHRSRSLSRNRATASWSSSTGHFRAELSNLDHGGGHGCLRRNLADIPNEHADVARDHLATYADYRDAIFTALNTASVRDGAFVYIPDGKVVETPIHLLFISTAEKPVASHPRVLIVAGAGSVATIIESYVSIGEESIFHQRRDRSGRQGRRGHTIITACSRRARTHFISPRHRFIRNAAVTTRPMPSRSALEVARHDLNVALTDENIETTIDGLYVVTGRQHTDSHTTIDHQKPHSVSNQLYKGILDGRSRAVFNGKVFVREGALLTDARQLNKNLLLSSDAHVDTKPQLEIFADDVKCAHGATVGQLEDEELFYLSTRGINPERARALLTYGFAEDVISRIKLKSARETVGSNRSR